jgi:hypothetical protein
MNLAFVSWVDNVDLIRVLLPGEQSETLRRLAKAPPDGQIAEKHKVGCRSRTCDSVRYSDASGHPLYLKVVKALGEKKREGERTA